MPKMQVGCGRALGHKGAHMSPASVRRMYDRAIEYHRDSRIERHRMIDRYKMDKGCIDCGYADNPVALDFDHRDPELKILGVSEMLTYSWRKIIAELDKCDVRCANCHRVKTQVNHQSQHRRRPASGITEDGPYDEILRTTSQVAAHQVHLHHLPGR